MALSAIFNFRIRNTYVKLAYLQADVPLQQNVYMDEPAVELDLEETMALQLLKLLYGLSDSRDIWYKKPDAHNKTF